MLLSLCFHLCGLVSLGVCAHMKMTKCKQFNSRSLAVGGLHANHAFAIFKNMLLQQITNFLIHLPFGDSLPKRKQVNNYSDYCHGCGHMVLKVYYIAGTRMLCRVEGAQFKVSFYLVAYYAVAVCSSKHCSKCTTAGQNTIFHVYSYIRY